MGDRLVKELPTNHDLTHLAAALRYVERFDTAIDAGAHRGIWTRELLKHFAQVVAIEPVISNYQHLPDQSLNIAAAVSDKAGRVRMVPGSENTGQWHIEGEGGVPAITIDSLGAAPSFIKIDVEGFEWFALKGAEQTINEHRPVVLIEENGLNRRYGIDDGQCFDLLESWGYRRVEQCNKDHIFVPR